MKGSIFAFCEIVSSANAIWCATSSWHETFSNIFHHRTEWIVWRPVSGTVRMFIQIQINQSIVEPNLHVEYNKLIYVKFLFWSRFHFNIYSLEEMKNSKIYHFLYYHRTKLFDFDRRSTFCIIECRLWLIAKASKQCVDSLAHFDFVQIDGTLDDKESCISAGISQ